MKTFTFYENAALGGEPRAMWNLSRCYQQGIGVQKNILKELKWLQKAAEAGHLRSMLDIVELFDKGERVYRNVLFAEKWYGAAMLELWNRTIRS